MTTVVTYSSGTTTFTWSIVNTNPGNGSGGTFQDLSHWSQELSTCVDLDDLNPPGPAPSNYTYGPDNSQDCLTGSVVKFDRGTSGTNTSTYQLSLDGYYVPVLVDAAFKAGNETCCGQIWGVGCCELEVTCPASTNLGTFNCNTLGNIPAGPTTESAAEGAPYSIVIGDNNCGTIRVAYNDNAPITACTQSNQTITRTVTIWDDLNNNSLLDTDEESETCTFTFVVEADLTPPVITCPADLELDCNATVPAANINLVTATDLCPGTVTVTHLGDQTTLVNCLETTIRTYQAEDACGNKSTCTQTITRIVDNTPPTITCPANQLLVATVPPVDISSVTVSDNCPGDITVTHLGDETTVANCVETTLRTYQAEDACGHKSTCVQTITRNIDNIPPVITCPDDLELDCNEAVPAANPALVTATDACGGNVTVTHLGDETTTVNCIETTLRTYQAEDASGNKSTCVQTITRIVDNEPPQVTQAEGADFTAACDTDPDGQFTDPVFSDNCGTPGVTVETTNRPGDNNSVIYTRTWTATDACDHTTVVSQEITVPPCPIPPPTGDEGCTPGYWKTHPEAWGCGYDPSGSDATNFFTAFDITNTRGLSSSLTLMDALNLGGGGYYALARHAAAALLNACHQNVDYPYTTEEIIAAVDQMFETGTATLGGVTYTSANALKDALASANELGCPLNNSNYLTPVTSSVAPTESTGLKVAATPNPFYSAIRFQFTAPISGNAQLEIYDLMGRKLANVFRGMVDAGVQKTIDYHVPTWHRVPMIYKLTIGDKTSFGKMLPGSTD